MYIAAVKPNDADGSVKVIAAAEPFLLFNPAANVGMMAGGLLGASIALDGIGIGAAITAYSFSFGATYKSGTFSTPSTGTLSIDLGSLPPSPTDPWFRAPQIADVSVASNGQSLTIVGAYLSTKDLAGNEAGPLYVQVTAPGGKVVKLTPKTATGSQITVDLPANFALAGAEIQVLRVLQDRTNGTDGVPSDLTQTQTSNTVTVRPRYGLTFAVQANKIVVLSNGDQIAQITQDQNGQPLRCSAGTSIQSYSQRTALAPMLPVVTVRSTRSTPPP